MSRSRSTRGRWWVAVVLVAATWFVPRLIPAPFWWAVRILREFDAPAEIAERVERAYGRTITETWPGRTNGRQLEDDFSQLS